MPRELSDDKSALVQVMAWPQANVDSDLCRRIASLGHNELTGNSQIKFSVHGWIYCIVMNEIFYMIFLTENDWSF